MGQAILIKAGFGGGNGGGNSNSGEDANITGWHVKTEIITTNGYFSVPKAKDQEFHVRLFGGGGGGGDGGYGTYANYGGRGGGGGNMNNDTLILNQGESIQISIGAGGSAESKGGTTSFGTYLSATGGESPSFKYGGNGGTGGGGIWAHYRYGAIRTVYDYSGGGNGTYGGGGGCTFSIYDSNDQLWKSNAGKGGTYGGDGDGGKNGTNTIGMTGLDFVGEGKARGSNLDFASGGYGGCGGFNLGGGGGYGGDGGNGISNNDSGHSGTTYYIAAGGGGGYGGKGGDGYATNTHAYGGGGGGYGPSNYGAGGRGDRQSGKAGVCIITYQAPVYSN